MATFLLTMSALRRDSMCSLTVDLARLVRPDRSPLLRLPIPAESRVSSSLSCPGARLHLPHPFVQADWVQPRESPLGRADDLSVLLQIVDVVPRSVERGVRHALQLPQVDAREEGDYLLRPQPVHVRLLMS